MPPETKKKVATITTTPTSDKTPKKIYVDPKFIRLAFYGGAKSSSENSSFYFAIQNVIKDYNGDAPITQKFVDSAKIIVDTINSQKYNFIQSVYIASHGNQYGVYFIKNSNMNKTLNMTAEEIFSKKLAANLYSSGYTKSMFGKGLHDDTRTINDINFSKFTNNAKIEIHGCMAGGDSNILFFNNFCKNLSQELFKAGKKDAVVIGHATKANPNIKGTKENSEQDYRQLPRRVYSNGSIILTTSKEGRISPNEIKKALGK